MQMTSDQLNTFQEDLSRTEQRYIGGNAIKVNTINIRLDLFIAS